MQLFYDPDCREGTFDLREEEAVHAGRVLRKRAGDELTLVDGHGGWYRATIEEIGKRKCSVTARLERREAGRARHHSTLIVAPTKGMDRFEWLVEKATEIGVDRIRPVITTHSERRRLRNDRLLRVAETAMKQSLRAWLPQIGELMTFNEVLESLDSGNQRYLAYLGKEAAPLLHSSYTAGQHVVVGIGPEGGFSSSEANLAKGHGFEWVSLGPQRLRTETAALTALQAVEAANW